MKIISGLGARAEIISRILQKKIAHVVRMYQAHTFVFSAAFGELQANFYNWNRARVFGRYPNSNISDFGNFSRLKPLILTPFELVFERLSDHLKRSCRHKLTGGVLAPDTFCLVSHWRLCQVKIRLLSDCASRLMLKFFTIDIWHFSTALV